MSGRPEPGAVVAIWNGIAPAMRDEFLRWHETQHIPERVGIEGFLRGRRYRALAGAPAYFTRYDLVDAAVLTSEAYLARLEAPTAWTLAVVPQFLDVSRSLCDVVAQRGAGEGAFLATARLTVADGAATPLDRLREIVGALEASGLHTARLLATDRAASAVVTREKRNRGGETLVPHAALLAECRSAEALAVVAGELRRQLGRVPGIDVVFADYELEFDLVG